MRHYCGILCDPSLVTHDNGSRVVRTVISCVCYFLYVCLSTANFVWMVSMIGSSYDKKMISKGKTSRSHGYEKGHGRSSLVKRVVPDDRRGRDCTSVRLYLLVFVCYFTYFIYDSIFVFNCVCCCICLCISASWLGLPQTQSNKIILRPTPRTVLVQDLADMGPGHWYFWTFKLSS